MEPDMTRTVLLLPLMLTLSLAACARTPGTAQTDPARVGGDEPPATTTTSDALGGYYWRLQDATDARGKRIDALLVRPEQPLQFNIADGRIAVLNACNQIAGTIRIDGDEARVERLISTKMACLDAPIMALDGAISLRLQGVARIALRESDPPQLLWTAANGDVLRFVGEPTPETRYGSAGDTIFLEVAPQTKPCRPGLAPNTVSCLQIRELRYDDNGLRVGEPGPWQTSSIQIAGFRHEAGIRTVLRVKRFAIRNAPADTPQVAYILDTAIESEMVAP
jgi:heat shock protein HslJ